MLCEGIFIRNNAAPNIQLEFIINSRIIFLRVVALLRSLDHPVSRRSNVPVFVAARLIRKVLQIALDTPASVVVGGRMNGDGWYSLCVCTLIYVVGGEELQVESNYTDN